jgi:DNA-binding beta-propeller fold protein YncE
VPKKLSRRGFLQVSSQVATLTGLALVGCGSSQNSVFTNNLTTSVPTTQSLEILENSTLSFDNNGTSYRLDFLEHTVARLSLTGQVVWQVGELGSGDGIFNFPVALAADNDGRLYVADRGNGEIDVLDGAGNLITTLGRGQLLSARDLALDAGRGLIYVCDAPAHRVAVFDLEGNLLRSLGEFGFEGSQLNFPTGVAVTGNGDVHVVDSGNAEVQVHDAEGTFLFTYGGRGNDLGEFNIPRSVVVDSKGQSLVADGVSGLITRFSASGVAIDRFQPTLPDGRPVGPLYLSIGPSDLLIVSGSPSFQASA